jgi:hypothetical protein
MKNRASSHLLIILIILGLEITGYFAVHRSGLLRGYETSVIGAVRDLMMFVPLIFIILWLSRSKRFAGNWVLFTTAILLFAFGMLIQYRLYSDPEYNARNKAAAREDGTASNSGATDRDQPASGERIELLTLERTHIQLHVDSRLLVLRFRNRLLVVRARRLSLMATAK